jgi:hypothetical protein
MNQSRAGLNVVSLCVWHAGVVWLYKRGTESAAPPSLMHFWRAPHGERVRESILISFYFSFFGGKNYGCAAGIIAVSHYAHVGFFLFFFCLYILLVICFVVLFCFIVEMGSW